MNNFSDYFLKKFIDTTYLINFQDIEGLVESISLLKKRQGRIFFLGNGGSLASCSHAVNDFRKIANIECYNIADNASELSARTNDDGFDSIFCEWLKTSHLNSNDALFILSVGGGNQEKEISVNIIKAINYAVGLGCDIYGIVGKDGGYVAKYAYYCIIIPTVDNNLITPIVESFHSIICHLIVSHPKIKVNQTKWESINE